MTIEEFKNFAATVLQPMQLTITATECKLAGKKVPDTTVNGILATHSTTLDELRKAMREFSAAQADNDGYVDKSSMIIDAINAPGFVTTRWNKCDDALFGCFKLVADSTNTAMLIIDVGDNNMQTVMLGGTRLSVLADITTACANTFVTDNDGKRVSLLNQINDRYDAIMERAKNKLVKLNNDLIAFGEWVKAKDGLPSMMLHHSQLLTHMSPHKRSNGTADITQYLIHTLYFRDGVLSVLADHYDYLTANASNIIRMPKLYSNKADEPALHHIDLDTIIDSSIDYPTWRFYLGRYTAAEAKVFSAYIWSIFDSTNKGRQMLYIYDKDGFSGKSVVTNVIAEHLGAGLTQAIQKDSLSNQFGLAKIWDKRLIIIDDNKNPNLIRSEKMHMILGGGLGEIEQKGRGSFTAKLQAKIIASGNTRLTIDADAIHERTRVIVITPKITDEILKQVAELDENGNVKLYGGKPQLIGDPSFADKLSEEFTGFLGYCRECYRELCPTNGSIILPNEMLSEIDTLSDDIDDIIDNMVDTYFVVGSEHSMSPTDFRRAIERAINATHISDDRLNYDNVKTHLEKKYGIAKKCKRIDGSPRKMIIGIAEKDIGERDQQFTALTKRLAGESILDDSETDLLF